MSHRNTRSLKSAGFTLVEILIVVVILGILAAIVIPQFTNASQAAKASQLTAQLQTIRSQLELAQIEHQGQYPPLTTDARGWGLMTTPTLQTSAYTTGVASGGGKVDGAVGPYLQKSPTNSFFAGADKTSISADTSGAWKYVVATGEVSANINTMTSDQAEELGMDIITAANPRGDVNIVTN